MSKSQLDQKLQHKSQMLLTTVFFNFGRKKKVNSSFKNGHFSTISGQFFCQLNTYASFTIYYISRGYVILAIFQYIINSLIVDFVKTIQYSLFRLDYNNRSLTTF